MTSPLHKGCARVYPSLVRPIHIAGIERRAAGLLVLVNCWVTFGLAPGWTATAALVSFSLFVVLPVLRRATKRDPRIIGVYRAHLLRAGIYQGHPPHTHAAPQRVRTL